MSTADDYRRLAAKCASMAARSADMRTRAMLLHLAEVWTKLAEEEGPPARQQQQVQPKPPDHSQKK